MSLYSWEIANSYQGQRSSGTFLASPLPFFTLPFLSYPTFYLFLFLLIKAVGNTFSKLSLIYFPQWHCGLETSDFWRLLLNTKGPWALGFPTNWSGGGGWDILSPKCPPGDMCLFGVALKSFHTVTRLLELLKGRYLNTWHCSYSGIHVICIELRDSVS